jgi:hypothetical protein
MSIEVSNMQNVGQPDRQEQFQVLEKIEADNPRNVDNLSRKLIPLVEEMNSRGHDFELNLKIPKEVYEDYRKRNSSSRMA